jgi:hypothetical protein
MKFINAADFYRVKTLILGGDLTAKGFVPIVRQPDGSYKTSFHGIEYHLREGNELEDLQKRIRWAGLYTYITSPGEVAELGSQERTRDLMLQLAKESLERWMKISEEKVRRSGARILVTGGNDDEFAIDEILERSKVVSYVEGRVVRLDDDHEMISTGFGNPTPWHCPRDITEEELGEKMDELASKVENMRQCIFNVHVPPFDSRLDDAPKLDENLNVKEGGVTLVPVGSVAVRRAIEKYQPLLSLHGHVHESKGTCKIGETLCINPGSTYTSGMLQAVIVEIESNHVKGFTPVTG